MKPASRTIVFASHVSDFRGGAERSMIELILNTKEHDYRPVVILPRKGEIEKSLKKAGIKTYLVNYDWWVRGASEKKIDFTTHRTTNGTAIAKMSEIISKERPFLTVSYTGVFPWLAYASTITRTPHVWQLCELLDDGNQWQYRIPVKEMMSVINSMSVKIFANSNVCKDRLRSYLPSHKDSIDVIYPYVDHASLTKLASELRPKLPKNKKIISLVGNIQPTKGQLDAVEAIANLRSRGRTDIMLILVGNELDHSYAQKIRDVIANNSLDDCVMLTGYSTNPHVYVKNSDIALVCSSNETFGRVTIEAMLLGTPVIGASAYGTQEILGTDSHRGLLYNPGDSNMLSEKILLLLDDNQLRKTITENAQDYVARKFTREKNQEPFFGFINSIDDSVTTQPAPFTDFIFARRQMLRDNKLLINELVHKNEILSRQMVDMLSSKKWVIVSNAGKVLALFRTFPTLLKNPVKRIYKRYLLTSLFTTRKIKKTNQVGDVVVVVCLWCRFDRIEQIITQLDQQDSDKKIDLLFWNNNYAKRKVFAREIKSCKSNKNINSVSIFNSPINVGGFGRFYAARKIRGTYKYMIFLDDDQNVSKHFVDDCSTAYQTKQIASFWAFSIKSDYYWDRCRAKQGESAEYCGTGGMVIDPRIFADKALFNCPDKYWFIEDTWLSFYARKRGWKLTGLDTPIEFVMTDKDQGNAIFDLKADFYRYLIRSDF